VLEAADERLKQWAGGVLAGADALRLAPPAAAETEGVSLYLLELLPKPPARGAPRPYAEVVLRYLVSAAAATPEAAHAVLGRLLASAVAQADFEVEAAPPPLALWQAFGVAPRPAFVIRVVVRIDLPTVRARPVRQPMAVDLGLVVPLHGTLLGPGDVPIAGALVEAPSVHRATHTDPRGRFTLPGLPAASPCVLRIVAKGREFILETAPGADAPLRVPLELMEE
jgi:hypothetical protein